MNPRLFAVLPALLVLALHSPAYNSAPRKRYYKHKKHRKRL